MTQIKKYTFEGITQLYSDNNENIFDGCMVMYHTIYPEEKHLPFQVEAYGFLFCIGELSAMTKYTSKIKNIILWIIFFPVSVLGGALGVKLYYIFLPPLEEVGGMLAIPQIFNFIFSFCNVIIFFFFFYSIATKIIPSSAKVKFLISYFLILSMSCIALIFRIYTSRFYPLGSLIALFLNELDAKNKISQEK